MVFCVSGLQSLLMKLSAWDTGGFCLFYTKKIVEVYNEAVANCVQIS